MSQHFTMAEQEEQARHEIRDRPPASSNILELLADRERLLEAERAANAEIERLQTLLGEMASFPRISENGVYKVTFKPEEGVNWVVERLDIGPDPHQFWTS